MDPTRLLYYFWNCSAMYSLIYPYFNILIKQYFFNFNYFLLYFYFPISTLLPWSAIQAENFRVG